MIGIAAYKRTGIRRANCVRAAAVFMANRTWMASPATHLVHGYGGPDSPEELLTS